MNRVVLAAIVGATGFVCGSLFGKGHGETVSAIEDKVKTKVTDLYTSAKTKLKDALKKDEDDNTSEQE